MTHLERLKSAEEAVSTAGTVFMLEGGLASMPALASRDEPASSDLSHSASGAVIAAPGERRELSRPYEFPDPDRDKSKAEIAARIRELIGRMNIPELRQRMQIAIRDIRHADIGSERFQSARMIYCLCSRELSNRGVAPAFRPRMKAPRKDARTERDDVHHLDLVVLDLEWLSRRGQPAHYRDRVAWDHRITLDPATGFDIKTAVAFALEEHRAETKRKELQLPPLEELQLAALSRPNLRRAVRDATEEARSLEAALRSEGRHKSTYRQSKLLEQWPPLLIALRLGELASGHSDPTVRSGLLNELLQIQGASRQERSNLFHSARRLQAFWDKTLRTRETVSASLR